MSNDMTDDRREEGRGEMDNYEKKIANQKERNNREAFIAAYPDMEAILIEREAEYGRMICCGTDGHFTDGRSVTFWQFENSYLMQFETPDAEAEDGFSFTDVRLSREAMNSLAGMYQIFGDWGRDVECYKAATQHEQSEAK